jgi:DNA-binding NtrC family response regulator
LPALRERKSDILLLANHFLKKFAAQYGMPPKTLGKNAEKSLLTWAWPGNVRELENRTHKAVILTTDPLIMTEDLGFDKSDKTAFKEGNSGWKSLKEAREAAEKACIEDCLRYFRGNVSQTSVALNVDRKVLTRLIEKLGIESKSFKR